MDVDTLAEGIVWDFETYPEYLDAVARAGHGAELHRVRGPHAAAPVRHGRRRVRARGDAGGDRADGRAGAARRSRPARAGFSTSFSFTHRGIDGKPVPSRFADADEVEALFLAAGEAGKGVVLITPGEQCTYADMYEWQPRIGRPFTYPLFASARRRAPAQRRRCTTRAGPGRRRLAAGDAAAADHAVHDGRRRSASTSARSSASSWSRTARRALPRTPTPTGGPGPPLISSRRR